MDFVSMAIFPFALIVMVILGNILSNNTLYLQPSISFPPFAEHESFFGGLRARKAHRLDRGIMETMPASEASGSVLLPEFLAGRWPVCCKIELQLTARTRSFGHFATLITQITPLYWTTQTKDG
jgi:hypothetical protein